MTTCIVGYTEVPCTLQNNTLIIVLAVCKPHVTYP